MSNKPKLRFKEFNDEWNIAKIQQLLDNRAIISHLDGNHGALYPRSQEFVSVGVPYITANDFSTGKVDTITCKKLTPERASQFKKGVAINGDVLFAHNATVGPVALLKTTEPFVILSTTATYFRTNNSILLNTFLKTVLEAPYFVKQYTPIMKQTTRNQVPLLTQRKLNIAFPSIAEQKKIAEFLSKVDEVISEREEEVKDLEKQKKGLMQKIFSQQLRFTDSNNNPYPDWEEKLIKDIATLTSSKRVHVADYVPKGIPFYRGKEISELRENKPISDILYISEETYEDFKGTYGVPQQNDILITAVGTLGNVWSISNSKPFYFKDGNLIWFRNVKENSKFMEYLFTHTEGKKRILDSAIGSNQKALTIVNLNKLRFKFPCLEEQQKIANVLSKLDELIEEKKALLSDWQSFKKGLLQQMFV